MTAALDVFHAAKLLIDQNGDDASDFALQRAEQLLDAGDIEGAAIWRQIFNAIVELQRKRVPGEPLN